MSGQREALDDGSAMRTSSGDGSMGLLTIECTTTQGDHKPYWITPANEIFQDVDNYVYTARYKFIHLQLILMITFIPTG